MAIRAVPGSLSAHSSYGIHHSRREEFERARSCTGSFDRIRATRVAGTGVPLELDVAGTIPRFQSAPDTFDESSAARRTVSRRRTSTPVSVPADAGSSRASEAMIESRSASMVRTSPCGSPLSTGSSRRPKSREKFARMLTCDFEAAALSLDHCRTQRRFETGRLKGGRDVRDLPPSRSRAPSASGAEEATACRAQVKIGSQAPLVAPLVTSVSSRSS